MATMHRYAQSERRIDYGIGLYLVLHMAGFFATTLLVTWGVFVLFFLAIGGLSLDGMMHQVANFSTRYLAADESRLADFKYVVGILHMVVAAAIVFFRRHALLPRDVRRQEHGA